jgi:hypothetical protein
MHIASKVHLAELFLWFKLDDLRAQNCRKKSKQPMVRPNVHHERRHYLAGAICVATFSSVVVVCTYTHNTLVSEAASSSARSKKPFSKQKCEWTYPQLHLLAARLHATVGVAAVSMMKVESLVRQSLCLYSCPLSPAKGEIQSVLSSALYQKRSTYSR